VIGFVRDYSNERKCGHIITKGGGEYFVRVRDIVPDEASFAYLVSGEEVLFEVGEVAPNGYERAVEVEPLHRKAQQLPDDYEELVVLTCWNGGQGWARREYGADILVNRCDIRSLGEETLRAGSKLFCGSEGDREGRRYKAVRIDIATPETKRHAVTRKPALGCRRNISGVGSRSVTRWLASKSAIHLPKGANERTTTLAGFC
jgi:cold shock CspA family protein